MADHLRGNSDWPRITAEAFPKYQSICWALGSGLLKNELLLWFPPLVAAPSDLLLFFLPSSAAFFLADTTESNCFRKVRVSIEAMSNRLSCQVMVSVYFTNSPNTSCRFLMDA